MTIAVNPWVERMQGYVPGEQPSDLEMVKLNTNEAPYPAAPEVTAAILAETEKALFNKYPDPASTILSSAIAARLGVSAEEVVCGNGSDESLRLLVHAFTRPGAGDRIAMCNPTYSLYRTLADMFGVEIENHVAEAPQYSLPDSFVGTNAKILFLPNPNPPIGTYYENADLECLAAADPDRLVVIDEAYVDFAPGDAVAVYRKYNNVVLTRTFSKSYSLAGLRAGFLVARPELTSSLNKIKDSYNISRLTQVAALAAWDAREYHQDMIDRIREDREFLAVELTKRGFTVAKSHGNFLFARKGGAKKLYWTLKERKVLVRYFDVPGLEDGLRITIGTRSELEKLLSELDGIAG